MRERATASPILLSLKAEQRSPYRLRCFSVLWGFSALYKKGFSAIYAAHKKGFAVNPQTRLFRLFKWPDSSFLIVFCEITRFGAGFWKAEIMPKCYEKQKKNRVNLKFTR